MLKHRAYCFLKYSVYAAAFRRLCVETPVITENGVKQLQPPSGGCVLKQFWRFFIV